MKPPLRTELDQQATYYATYGTCAVVRRALRLVCPGTRWFGRPTNPMRADGLLIWNAPPMASVAITVCGMSLAGSSEGLPASMFDPSGPFERLNTLIEWPTIDTAVGVEIELRSSSGALITSDTNPDIEIAMYGALYQR